MDKYSANLFEEKKKRFRNKRQKWKREIELFIQIVTTCMLSKSESNWNEMVCYFLRHTCQRNGSFSWCVCTCVFDFYLLEWLATDSFVWKYRWRILLADYFKKKHIRLNSVGLRFCIVPIAKSLKIACSLLEIASVNWP